MAKTKLYKVISKDLTSRNGGNYLWKDYLPKGKRKGKWTPQIKKVVICEEGFHLTKHWNMWIQDKDDLIFEAEAKDIIEWDYDKCVCKSVRLIKQIFPKYNTNCNTGHWNTGHCNTGDRNTGHSNTGDRNTGHSNTGDINTGDSNTGDRNTGHWNTGHWNTGHWNTGHCNTGDINTGDSNTGHRNTGHCNTGHRNTGHCNTGDRNTGDSNTGHWNTGDRNTGFLNTAEPLVRIFNKETTVKRRDIKFPGFFQFNLIDGDYKKSWKKSFENVTKEDIRLLLALPNFDYRIFEEITGISKKMIERQSRC